MDLQVLLAQPEILEKVCANLTFEDGIALREYLNIPEIPCRLSIIEPNHQIISLPKVDNRNIRGYQLLKKWGSRNLAIEALNKNQFDLLEFLVANGLNPNYRLSDQHTLLSYAAMKKLPKMVSYLIQQGADIRTMTLLGLNILTWAAYSGYYELVQEIVQKYPRDSQFIPDLNTALREAINTGHIEIVKFLINQGAELNPSLFGTAVRSKKLEMVKFLVSQGLNVNTPYQNSSLLEITVWSNQPDMAKYLLDSGANPNVVDGFGRPILYDAISEKQPEIVKSLLEHGANPQIFPDGTTPLELAISRDQTKIVEYLLESGADIHRTNAQGDTILITAIKFRNPEIVQMLLDRGADVNTRSYYFTPLELASSPEMEALLTPYGAQ